ncbi:hypothetical protein GQ44DRAFT_702960 [Phaeosphaeriaceae sp. PMI808]|nr:hypothetical protein GQ44DRAFT_702960 [Phaeosphaeriaceae sp. PMI808]
MPLLGPMMPPFEMPTVNVRVLDKLIALAHLLDEVARVTRDVYFAGLWKKDLGDQLY